MANSPIVAAPYITEGQEDKEQTHSDGVNVFETAVHHSVIDSTRLTTPASPTNGDAYIVGTSGAGTWNTKDNDIASYYDGWKFITPVEGWNVYDRLLDKYLHFDGSNWAEALLYTTGINLIINGDFRVAQRGTSFTAATAPLNSDDTYLLDRWILLSDGNDIVDVTQGTDGSVGNATYLQADVETVSKKFGFLTIIENKDIHELLSETNVVSLSFNALVSDATKLSRIKAMVLSWTGTADAPTSDIVNAWGVEGTSPTVVASWTIEGDSGDLGVTTTDIRYTLRNVAIDASGVTNIAVFIWSDDVATNDTLGTLLKITDVQLQPGPATTSFQRRSVGQELARCQRYFVELMGGVALFENLFTGAVYATTDFAGPIRFPVPMRAAPTVSESGTWAKLGGSAGSLTSLAFSEISPTSMQARGVGTGFVIGEAITVRASNVATNSVTLSAEL